MRSDNTLILFTKTPKICRVKTRMRPALSHRECLFLHKKLTSHAINLLQANSNFKLTLYATQIDRSRNVYPRGITIKQQSGLNLGERMANAIKQEIKYTHRVVLIGSDFLTLDINHINSAFEKLFASNDIVLGPTVDGGYGLVGMQKHKKFLFENIPWGMPDVLDKTIASARKHGCKINMLSKISDLDTIEDLHHLTKTNTLPGWANNLARNHAN